MSEQLQFRSAAFGGFQKQDVLNYIENTAKEHKNKVEELEKELSEVKARKEVLEEQEKAASRREAAQREREEGLNKQVQELSTRLHEQEAALEAARAELSHKADMLNEARALIQKLEPAAEGYESLKDKAAGIELDAYRRAQLIEAEGREQLKELRVELERWLDKVRAGYDRLRTDVDATISHASGELDRVIRSLQGVSEEFAGHDTALDELAEIFLETEEARRPQPADGERDCGT